MASVSVLFLISLCLSLIVKWGIVVEMEKLDGVLRFLHRLVFGHGVSDPHLWD